jgi:hypothetical protein
VHNETLSVVAMRVGNKDRSPASIHSGDTAPAPTGFAEFVGGYDNAMRLHYAGN